MPSNISEEAFLEYVYGSLTGDKPTNFRLGRNADWLLSKIGQVIGLDFSSGYETRESKYIRLYEYSSGITWTGARSSYQVILPSILAAPLFSLRDNLQAYWPLGFNGVLDLNDRGVSPKANLSNVSVVTREAGPSSVLNDSANFVAGSSQRLDFADLDKLSIVGDATIAGWVYLQDKPAAQRSFINKWTGTGNQREWFISHLNTTDRFRFQISPNGTASGNVVVDSTTFGAPVVQTWYFVVVQFVSSTRKLQISVNNGAFDVSSGTLATQPFTGTGIGGFGNNFPTGTYFSGRTSHWAKWNKLLSANEIAYAYNGGQGRYLVPLA